MSEQQNEKMIALLNQLAGETADLARQQRVAAYLIAWVIGLLRKAAPDLIEMSKLKSDIAAAMRLQGGFTERDEVFLNAFLTEKASMFSVVAGGKPEPDEGADR